MRLNKIKGLLMSLVCLSVLSACQTANYENEEINYQINQDYKQYLAASTNSLYNESVKSVVSILTIKDKEASSIGSGFIYAQDENFQYVITNHHVVDESDSFKVISYTGQVKEGVLLGPDSVFDLALLKVSPFMDTKVSTYPNSDFTLIENPSVGDEVYAIGNPGNIDNQGTMTTGIVSGVDRNSLASSSFENADYAIQLDVALNPGNSGGPLFNMKGEVIGINTFKLATINGVTYKGINFALPIQDALLIANKIKETGKFTRTSLGKNTYFETRELTIYEKDFLKLDRSYDKGIIVKDIGASSVLSFPKYSIITNINGYEVNTLAEFRRRLYQIGPNQIARITYYEYDKNGYSSKQKELVVTTNSQGY